MEARIALNAKIVKTRSATGESSIAVYTDSERVNYSEGIIANTEPVQDLLPRPAGSTVSTAGAS